MNHWNELHNLAARGELVQSNSTERRVHQRACLPPDRPAYERGMQPDPLTHDAKFTTYYICNLRACEFRSDDAVAAVNHVLASGHEVLIHGSIQAVPVTVLEIEEHDA